ncbi:MAG: TIM barrel protein [Planctomycetota bacterium]
MGLPVALQLYSVREQCASDLRGTLARVASWGYHGVEFAGLHGHAPQAVRDMLDDFELRCCGAHVPLEMFAADLLDETLETYSKLGCPSLVVPWLPPHKRDSISNTQRTAEEFTRIAERVGPRGFTAGFHAHGQDMVPLEPQGGIETSPWYVIGRNTPNAFVMQYDTGNGAAGGADAVRPIHDFPGRAKSLHLKAYVAAKDGEGGNGQATIADDDLDWDQILHAARGVGGTHWLVVEQEGHPTLKAMDAAEASLRGLQRFVKPVML